MENQNKFYIPCLLHENRAVNDILWKNVIEPARPQLTVWRMRIACWSPKATNAQSEYVTLIAFLEYVVAQLVDVLRYKPEGREFESRWCHWIFSLT
jgi:hypothetical protein